MAKKLKIEKGKNERKWKLIGCADSVLDSDLISKPHIEIFGNNKISIDGCEGVFEYEDSYLKLKLQKGMLILCGNGFDIVFFENKLITVKGKISSVEFCV